MARKKIIAGNWKMFKTRDEALAFIYAVNNDMPSIDKVDTVICAPFVVLRCLVKRQGENLRIGAQNMHFEEHGAFTGEVSAAMLKELNVKYTIIGHSERRQYWNDNDIIVNRKAHAAIDAGLYPIICVGESKEQRELGVTKEVIDLQVKTALSGIPAEKIRHVVIAYEPLWAIGTGDTATAEQANEVCEEIRTVIRKLYGARVARSVTILYGGSMNENNAHDLLAQPDVDGGLIGGASLVPKKFTEIINAANQE